MARLHAWLVPSAAQNLTSVTDLSTTTSKRNNKDTAPKHVAATCMTPLSDIYDVYSRYGFHPPSCPMLTLSEFHDLIRNTSVSDLATETSTTEPVWNQPTTGLALRNDIPLDLLRSTSSTNPPESPKSAKSGNPPPASSLANTTSNVLVQASFRYPPDEWIDAEPYLAPTTESEGTNTAPPPVTKGKHFKEHDIVWRSVGLNFARWVKAERGKRSAKADLAVAAAVEVERERETKRRRQEYGQPLVQVQMQMQNGAPVHRVVQGGQGQGQGQGQGMAQASVFARPAHPKTPEERRRLIMTAWYVLSSFSIHILVPI